MKLYRVQNYEEIYFKSLYKPIFYDPVHVIEPNYEQDPAQFVGKIVNLASMDDGLWLFIGENEQLFLHEVSNCLSTTPPALWDEYKNIIRQWYEIGPRTPELHRKLITTAHKIWSFADQQKRSGFAAQRFWESVRSSGVWQALYKKGLSIRTGTVPQIWSAENARENADRYTRGFLQHRISAKEIRAFLDRPSVCDYIENALSWIAALGGILLAKLALFGLAAGCITALIFNPKEWGRKLTHYYEGRHLMVYDEYLWWADLIGRSPQGHYYYHCCAELQAKRLTHKAPYGMKTSYGDVFELTTWPAPIEKIDNWYWLFWPFKITTVFVGLCTRRSDPLLTVCEFFRKNEKPPTEHYLDTFGNLKQRAPKWWTEIEGQGCMRPAKDWCKEYYHHEELIPS